MEMKMEVYNSRFTGNQVDNAIKKIPQDNPNDDSVIVVGNDGVPSYKPTSEIVGKVDIVQVTGEATDKVMSQKAVTDALNVKASKTYIHKVNIFASNGGVPPMEIQVYSKSATKFTKISDIPDGCYTMNNVDDGYFGLLSFYHGKVGRIWNSGETLNCQTNVTPDDTRFIFSDDTVVEF